MKKEINKLSTILWLLQQTKDTQVINFLFKQADTILTTLSKKSVSESRSAECVCVLTEMIHNKCPDLNEEVTNIVDEYYGTDPRYYVNEHEEEF